MPTDLKTELREALQHSRVVVMSGPLGSDLEKLAEQLAEEIWPDHVRLSAVNLSGIDEAASGVVLHELERLLGAKDRSAFFSLLNGTRPLLMTCDRDWLEDVRHTLFDRPVVVTSLPEVVELPYVRDLSARLSENLPMSAPEFRERLREQLPTLGKAMAHPLIVKWSLMEWLDQQYQTHSRCIRQVTAEQSLTFHFRRALRAWTEEMVASDLEGSVRLFLACLRDKRIRPVVKYDVLKVLIQSNRFSLILDETRSDLFSDSRRLLKETFRFIRQGRVTTAPVVELVRFLDHNKALFDSYDHRWVLDILHSWFEGVTDEDPYPQGSKEAASLAKEWLGRFNTYDLQARYKECLKLLARIPLHSRVLLEEIEASRRDDLLAQVVKEEPTLLPVLKRDLPELRMFRAEPPPKPQEKPPQAPPQAKWSFYSPEIRRAHALVEWSRDRLVYGKDGDRSWKSVLQEAKEWNYDPSDQISRVGVRLVAAICARHNWEKATPAEREWILERLKESIFQSFDDWSESSQAHRFYFSPDRHTARAVVELLTQTAEDSHRQHLLKLLPHCLLHPSEEVRRYTALALGSNRQNLDPDIVARCASAMVEEDQLRKTMDRHTLSWELCKTFFDRDFEPQLARRTGLYPETRLRLKLLAHTEERPLESEREIDRLFADLEGLLFDHSGTLQDLLNTDTKQAPPENESLKGDSSTHSVSEAKPFWQRLEEAYRARRVLNDKERNELISELFTLRKTTPEVIKSQESHAEMTRWLLGFGPENEQKRLILEDLDMTHLDHWSPPNR